MEKTYLVTMPFAGAVTMQVEANNEDEAKEKFHEDFFNLKGGLNNLTIDADWEFYEQMHEGNVVHYQHWEVEIEEQ